HRSGRSPGGFGPFRQRDRRRRLRGAPAGTRLHARACRVPPDRPGSACGGTAVPARPRRRAGTPAVGRATADRCDTRRRGVLIRAPARRRDRGAAGRRAGAGVGRRSGTGRIRAGSLPGGSRPVPRRAQGRGRVGVAAPVGHRGVRRVDRAVAPADARRCRPGRCDQSSGGGVPRPGRTHRRGGRMNRQPRIFVLSREYPPNTVGGTSTVARNLSTGLSARGWKVVVVTTRPQRSEDLREDLAGVTVHRTGTNVTYNQDSGVTDASVLTHRRLYQSAVRLAGEYGPPDVVALPDLFC